VSLGSTSLWSVILCPFSALTLLVGQHEGHPACKELGVDMLVVTIWLELCMCYSSSCHHQLRHHCSSKIQNGWHSAYPGFPGKWLL